ncbi:MAG: M20/M25/M40 family metallo-hydrolase [Fidelibacterota bacterium]|nr:MAG: M20/M25/M40 family metallo-hydrolase [Candidatus Neomarinimicrobiota bacterium]
MSATRLRRYFLSFMLYVMFVPGAVTAQGLSAVERKIAALVEEQYDEAVKLLRRSVNINSGTFNLKGVRKVGRVYRRELAALGFDVQWLPMPDRMKRAGHLFAYRWGTQGKGVLLIGHLDTVFEKDSPFQRFAMGDTTATGPGVNDMKGGNVAIIYALRALYDLGLLDNTRIIVAFHGDEEEAGRPVAVSRRDIRAAARECDVALGFEGGVPGTGTIARRGISGWQLQVEGTQGHSSAVFGEQYGSGAIYEAARILYTFYDDVRGEEYLTFNPGVLLGGTMVQFDPEAYRGRAFGKSNVIAQIVAASGDLRFFADEQKEQARDKMRTIVSHHLPGTSATISFTDSYPAMSPTEGNYALLAMYDQVSRDLGLGAIQAYDPAGRGAADVSFVAAQLDCMDGLGVEGKGAHTVHETIHLPSLTRATQRAAVLIYRLTRAQNDGLNQQ